MKNALRWVMAFFFISFIACDNNIVPEPEDLSLDLGDIEGTGSFIFSDYTPLSDKPIRVYYHIPKEADINTPILIACHGAGREGAYTRDLFIEECNRRNVILFVPEFSDEFYPGSDMYNLGNVFEDGDRPSDATLNPEEEWTYSVIDPMFQQVKKSLGSNVDRYDLLGWSAGSQFVHRLAIFSGRYLGQLAPCSAGWYTTLDTTLKFPYGLKESPYEYGHIKEMVQKRVHVMVGALDNDPNGPSVRRNSIVDLQGTNRRDRAVFFYNQADTLAQRESVPFNWTLTIVDGANHDLSKVVTSAMNRLYP